MKLFQWYEAINHSVNYNDMVYIYLIRGYKNTFDAIEIDKKNFSVRFTIINKSWTERRIKTELFVECDNQFNNINVEEARVILASFLGSES